jgi:hypothetical protein
VHHDKPGTHWSKTPELHAAIASEIDPRLNCPSFWGFWFDTFVFRAFGGKPAAETIPADWTPLTIAATDEERAALKARYESGSQPAAQPATA